VAVTYLALLGVYSAILKHIVILDVLTIAAGFTLRAAGGAAAISVPISHWLLVCTTLLAMFIAFSKRRHELTLLTESAIDHRPILGDYTPYLLDQMISVVTASTLIAYAFYTISPETTQKFGTDLLSLTIPFPLYGIFRYLYLVHRRDKGGSPAELVVNDRPLLVCVALWALSVIVIIYQ
jgi:4-hydroxybenzoate polyprenyltransferase